MIENSIIINWLDLILNFSGGLAIFLYGMQLLINSLVSVAGNQLKYLLSKLTTNRFTGALTGTIVTAIIQSSSITTVLTVGLVSAGLINLSQAAGVIMGANLGTTITAQIIAFDLNKLALFMIVFGVVIQLTTNQKRPKEVGRLILGLGFVFFGMHMMSDAMYPLRAYGPFIEIMKAIDQPFLGIILGMVFTALVQSSSATLGIIIVLASNGFISLPAGIGLILGANIGTTVTAMLASIRANRDALRAALIHFQFNLLGALIWLPFIPELAYWAQLISNDETLVSTDNMARQVANAHTLFNLINLLIFLPLVPIFVRSAYKLVPLKAEERKREPIKPVYLDDSLLVSPTLAIDAVRQETHRFKGKFLLLMRHLMEQIQNNKMEKLSEQSLLLNQLKNYQTEIMRYLGKISQKDMSETEKLQFIQIMQAVIFMDSMLETIDLEFIKVLERMIELDIQPSITMRKWIISLAQEVYKAIDKSFNAITQEKGENFALQVLAQKDKVDHLIREVLQHQARHLNPHDERIAIFRLEMQLINGFRRLYTLSKRLARLALPEK
ncbi:MAG TPA: Na/Pi cotransporter family protein [Piscirickettsiaceae bacterium]|nr:Na/Pi cotransporter family protein [Piscirickettsiaceae bacterium]